MNEMGPHSIYGHEAWTVSVEDFPCYIFVNFSSRDDSESYNFFFECIWDLRPHNLMVTETCWEQLTFLLRSAEVQKSPNDSWVVGEMFALEVGLINSGCRPVR